VFTYTPRLTPSLLVLVCILLCAPRASAVFDNPCLIVNLASRDHPLEESWLTDGLFLLSTKHMSLAKLRSLNYEPEAESESPQTNFSLPAGSYRSTTGEIRFLPPEKTTVSKQQELASDTQNVSE